MSLGLILDDREDSLFGGNWSDEEENDCSGKEISRVFLNKKTNNFKSFFSGTPRHLPTLDELEDNYDPGTWSFDFTIFKKKIIIRT